jgi:hypothetical protein
LHSATVGEIECKVYSLDASTPTFTVTTPSNRNTGTASRLIGFGQLMSNSQTTTFWMDGMAGSDTGWIGPAATPPTGQLMTLLGIG